MNRLSGVETIRRSHISDKRGSFLKIMHGAEPGLPVVMGEIYLVRGYPGESRANHYHKVAAEWFTLISGTAILKLMDVESTACMTLALDAADPITVKVPPMVAHSFLNDGEEDFVLIAYSDERYDPADTIAFAFQDPA
jgi:dTDP-4-dehydrorhamnose 3,5-epimerase-like enzyme